MRMKIVMLQLNLRVGDCRANAGKIIEGYRKVCTEGAELVVAPELAILGGLPEDLDRLVNARFDAQIESLKQIIKNVGEAPLVVGAAKYEVENNGLFNAAMVIKDGRLQNHHRAKYWLKSDKAINEQRFFKPCTTMPYVYACGDKRIAILFGDDIWLRPLFQEPNAFDPTREIKIQSPDLLLVLDASPYYWGRGNERFGAIANLALDIQCPVIYVNQVGGNGGVIYDGRSFAINEKAELLGAAYPYEQVITLIDTLKSAENTYDYDHADYSQLVDALVLGVRDFVRKSGFQKAIVALSGGLDSALTFYLAAQALGPGNVIALSMPSPYNCRDSIEDAYNLAEACGAKCGLINITDIYLSFGKALDPVIGWNEPGSVKGDPTEENVQARIRGVINMAVSNREGAMLLSTGNKSEALVGYCTLYGDTCGSLAVVSGLYKTLIFELAKFINGKHGKEIIPWNTINKPPSAGLRPNQTDQDTLPPYKILDEILRFYVDLKCRPQEIVKMGFASKETVEWVMAQYHKTQYKRDQGAPGLKVMKEDFY